MGAMIDNFINELAWQAEIAVIENEMQAQKAAYEAYLEETKDMTPEEKAAYDKQEVLKQIEMTFGAEIAREAKAEIEAAEEATEDMSEEEKVAYYEGKLEEELNAAFQDWEEAFGTQIGDALKTVKDESTVSIEEIETEEAGEAAVEKTE